jgi:hypothetical protein
LDFPVDCQKRHFYYPRLTLSALAQHKVELMPELIGELAPIERADIHDDQPLSGFSS